MPERRGGRCMLVPLLALSGLVAAAPPPAAAPRLGLPVAPALAARADPTVFADGRGLPPGRGSAVEGRAVYAAQCERCHGPAGSGGNSGRLAGRELLIGTPLRDRTIGQYWPYATTLFDYTRRAMPIDRPGTLDDDAVYAVTAYLLHANEIIGEHDEMNARTLPRVAMPNRDGFLRADRPPR